MFFLVVFTGADRVAIAQEAEIVPQLSGSGAEYLKAVRFRGIDTDVRYFDPTGPAPPLETDAEPEPIEERRGSDVALDIDGPWRVVIIASLSILLLVILVSLARIGTAVSFRKETKNARRRAAHGAEEEVAEERLPPDLDAILRLSDRQEALIRLSQFVLTRCLNANGVMFQRSWTQREALRRLPDTLPHLADLQALVLDSERVNFGGRTVGESEFQSHIASLRPLLQGIAR